MPLRASSHPGSPNSPSCSAQVAWYSCWPGLSPWGESGDRTPAARTAALTRYRYATHVFNFKWRRWQPCRWLSGTNNCVKAHVGDVILVWRNTHDNTEPNAIWFPATLTDTDLNIQGIQVKYRTNGNCNIPATESRLWGTKWCHLFSAQVRMLRRGASEFFIQRFSIERSRTASTVAVLQRAM